MYTYNTYWLPYVKHSSRLFWFFSIINNINVYFINQNYFGITIKSMKEPILSKVEGDFIYFILNVTLRSVQRFEPLIFWSIMSLTMLKLCLIMSNEMRTIILLTISTKTEDEFNGYLKSTQKYSLCFKFRMVMA